MLSYFFFFPCKEDCSSKPSAKSITQQIQQAGITAGQKTLGGFNGQAEEKTKNDNRAEVQPGAVLALIEQHKLIAEGAGAVSVAAAMFNKVDIKGKKVVCLVSGGNIDVNILSRVITRGLVKSGRFVNLSIALTDKPGQLEKVSRIIAEGGGNVVSVQYNRSDENMAINSCFLSLQVETRDHAQIEEIKSSLEAQGLRIVQRPC